MSKLHNKPNKTAGMGSSKTVKRAYPLAIKAIAAVKKTVAPIPTNLVCSPSEQLSRRFLSAPEQRIKNDFNMIDFF
jgi:hypothetical protein